MQCMVKLVLSHYLWLILITNTAIDITLSVAHAAQVCQSAQGELVVRKKCKKGETKFSPTSLSVAVASSSGPLGPQGSQGIAGIEGPVGAQGPVGAPGAAGPQGVSGGKGLPGKIDFSGCRKVQNKDSNFINPNNGSVTVQISCDPSSEFLLHDSYSATPFDFSLGTTLFLQGRQVVDSVVNGDRRTTEAYITYERINVVNTGRYEVSVTGLCCPR